MPVTIGSNIASLRSQRLLGRATDELASTFERLASGQRINKASDDAAGLAISSSLNLKERVYGQAIRNGNDGVSLLNIADSALSTLSDITQRQLELAEQAANGTFTNAQRLSLQAESNALTKEYNRILGSTTFNNRAVFSSSASDQLQLQLGFGSAETLAARVGEQLQRDIGNTEFTGLFQFMISRPNDSAGTYVVLDFDGDGNLDIVAKEITDGTTSFYMGNGDGEFTQNTFFEDYTPGHFSGVADINGDGAQDIIMGNTVMYTQNGDLYFTTLPGGLVPITSVQYAVEEVDLNGDGLQDLFVQTATTGYTAIRGADGTFSAVRSIGFSPFSRDFGDINGDGKADVIYNASGTMTYRFGQGDGTFGAATSIVGLISAAFGDLNGDGRDDVVGLTGTSVARIYMSTGGSFTQSASITGVSQVWLQDQNQDGYVDIITAGSGAYRARFSNGDGSFTSATTLSLSTIGSANNFYDFDNDGIYDLLYVGDGSFESTFNIALGSSSTSLVASIFDLSSQSAARTSLDAIRERANDIQLERGNIGAMLSRTQTALNNLFTRKQNVQAASSRITDADIANDAGEQVRLSILQRSGAAVLAQANLAPQLALSLLR